LGLFFFHLARAELQIGRELGEQLLALAQRNHDRSRLVVAHRALGSTLFYLGEVALALEHTHRGAALYDTQPHVPVRLSGQDLGVFCRIYAAMALWLLGYPDQARAGIQSAHTLAQEINHPFCQAVAQTHVAWVHQYRREVQKTHEVAEATIVLTREQGFAFYLAIAVILWGWATALQDQWEEGIAQMRQGLDAYMALGSVLLRPWFLAMLAEAYGVAGQTEAGLEALTEALSCVGTTEER
jgi:predicted ATPase